VLRLTELFFRWEGEGLVSAHEGTAARGRTAAESGPSAAVSRPRKDRAENLMIVDMLRNDLGRVALTASVSVTGLFAVERYPTLLQMTSTVTARTSAGISEILTALFLCLCHRRPEDEDDADHRRDGAAPRGVYTGAVGIVGPGRWASFNVAIRTAVVDRERGEAFYGVGSGIVADSDPAGEYSECLLKARVLAESPLRLLETMRWTPEGGFFLEEEHLARLLASAAHFGAPLHRTRVWRGLHDLARRLVEPSRVRLIVDLDGGSGFRPRLSKPWLRSGARGPVARGNRRLEPWLFHKTTRREVYDAALAASGGRGHPLEPPGRSPRAVGTTWWSTWVTAR
jgi:para-aminobenzoate synthetase/4-amino-4-deoxychorismate lyase